jgi:hypothetical protein
LELEATRELHGATGPQAMAEDDVVKRMAPTLVSSSFFLAGVASRASTSLSHMTAAPHQWRDCRRIQRCSLEMSFRVSDVSG